LDLQQLGNFVVRVSFDIMKEEHFPIAIRQRMYGSF
jgi:hypothetical protein